MAEPLSTAGRRFEELVEIMARLRAPDGCPWDREQNFASIKKYTLEETYEVLDAIDREDWRGLNEELGDFMLQAVFYAQMAREQGLFAIEDSLSAICEKLIRRHPHIFSDGKADTADAVKVKWDEIKDQEKRDRGEKPKGMLDGIPRMLPALVEAQQISSKAAGAGFDWDNLAQVTAKVREEMEELEHARAEGNLDEVEGELGDLLFTIVNVARFLKVDPEQALRRTNAKFRKRFAHVEQGIAAGGKSLRESTLEEMEALWQQAKAL